MTSDKVIHKNIMIAGRVQGVGFRYSALKTASAMGIRGFVRNLPDGKVYIEAEGFPQPLGLFLEWCKRGPVRARITHVDIYDGELQQFNQFQVR